jgi:hypothetical protein
MHRYKFLIIKPNRCTNFSNLFLEWNSTCFRQFLCPSSGIFHCTHSNSILDSFILILLASCQQTCMTYTITVCTVLQAVSLSPLTLTYLLQNHYTDFRSMKLKEHTAYIELAGHMYTEVTEIPTSCNNLKCSFMSYFRECC